MKRFQIRAEDGTFISGHERLSGAIRSLERWCAQVQRTPHVVLKAEVWNVIRPNRPFCVLKVASDGSEFQ